MQRLSYLTDETVLFNKTTRNIIFFIGERERPYAKTVLSD